MQRATATDEIAYIKKRHTHAERAELAICTACMIPIPNIDTGGVGYELCHYCGEIAVWCRRPFCPRPRNIVCQDCESNTFGCDVCLRKCSVCPNDAVYCDEHMHACEECRNEVCHECYVDRGEYVLCPDCFTLARRKCP